MLSPTLSPASTAVQADLRHVIYALSDALDLVGVDDVAHGKRVGIMAAECARHMGLGESETSFLFDLGLLHDIGVSSTRLHQHLIEEFDWGGSQDHAINGHALIALYAPLAAMAEPIRYHHTRWDKLVTTGASAQVMRHANLILLVDRVDALTSSYYASNSVLLHADEIRNQIRTHSGTYFDPKLVETFLEVSVSEAFWLLLEPRSIQFYLQEMLTYRESCLACAEELKNLATLFAHIVDAKSPFTAEHSLGVARLSRLLAEKMGIDETNCDKLEIAGLLHDLGKLRVPDEILEKPAQLNREERTIINAHSFETFQILRNIDGFEEISRWAAYHHEEPDGSGYPFHLKIDAMPLEARILRVADIFQAMVQDRPYRKGLSASEVSAFLDKLVAEQRLDEKIVSVAKHWISEAMQAARSPARH
ncbi:MAG: HD domain-containing protein [Betaproteobacteria bacterium]|nr:HD domain-containing protein [Betaproteobacteria bacterium]